MRDNDKAMKKQDIVYREEAKEYFLKILEAKYQGVSEYKFEIVQVLSAFHR